MRRLFLVISVAIVAACEPLPIVDTPSTNQDSRVNYLILHFTSEDFAESMRLLATPVRFRVSVHYVVPEPGDPTYDRDELVVHRLVKEDRRARHAGVSYWAGRQNLNDSSIGIEIVNQSRCETVSTDGEINAPEDQVCRYLDYPEEQIELVIALCKDILARNPDIDPVDVIGHADIAPDRRVDPGPQFPWKRLYENGIGAWYDEETVARYSQQFLVDSPSIETLQKALNAYGYPVEATGEEDEQSRFAVRAFQIHFRPGNYDGFFDAETAAVLLALLEKYRYEVLSETLPDIVSSPAAQDSLGID